MVYLFLGRPLDSNANIDMTLREVQQTVMFFLDLWWSTALYYIM